MVLALPRAQAKNIYRLWRTPLLMNLLVDEPLKGRKVYKINPHSRFFIKILNALDKHVYPLQRFSLKGLAFYVFNELVWEICLPIGSNIISSLF